MANQTAILMPNLLKVLGNMFTQRTIQADSTNTFKANTLVKLSSGVLALVASTDVLVYGITPDASKDGTEKLPYSLPVGENHYPFSVVDGELEINIGHLSGTAIVTGASAKTLADITVGSKYGIATPTTGTYAGYQFLDPTNTSNLLFEITGIPDGQQTTDYNPRVRVKFVSGTIQ